MREVAHPEDGSPRVNASNPCSTPTTRRPSRLQVLKDDLEPIVASLWCPGLFVDPSLSRGDERRLLIDLIHLVVMAPDPGPPSTARLGLLLSDVPGPHLITKAASGKGDLVLARCTAQ